MTSRTEIVGLHESMLHSGFDENLFNVKHFARPGKYHVANIRCGSYLEELAVKQGEQSE